MILLNTLSNFETTIALPWPGFLAHHSVTMMYSAMWTVSGRMTKMAGAYPNPKEVLCVRQVPPANWIFNRFD